MTGNGEGLVSSVDDRRRTDVCYIKCIRNLYSVLLKNQSSKCKVTFDEYVQHHRGVAAKVSDLSSSDSDHNSTGSQSNCLVM